VVKVLTCVQAWGRVERIVFAPAPAEDGAKARAESRILPAFKRTAVDMGSKYERTVTRVAYPETVIITDWRAETQICLGIGRVPQL
jgi:hypothetical protein